MSKVEVVGSTLMNNGATYKAHHQTKITTTTTAATTNKKTIIKLAAALIAIVPLHDFGVFDLVFRGGDIPPSSKVVQDSRLFPTLKEAILEKKH